MRHALAHLVDSKADVRVIPAAARVYAQLVECSSLRPLCESVALPAATKTPCSGFGGMQFFQAHGLARATKRLSEPMLVRTFKFERLEDIPEEKGSATSVSFRVNADGRLDGIVLWWELLMERSETIRLSMAPSWVTGKRDMGRDHWMLCYQPWGGVPVLTGDVQEAVFCHDDFSMWFAPVRERVSTEGRVGPVECVCGLHSLIPPTRVLQLADNDYVENLRSVLRTTLRRAAQVHTRGNLRIAVVGDLGLPARLLLADSWRWLPEPRHAFSLCAVAESYPALYRLWLRERGSYCASGLWECTSEVSLDSGPRLVVDQCAWSDARAAASLEKELAPEDVGEGAVIVLSEPYFFHGPMPWHSLALMAIVGGLVRRLQDRRVAVEWTAWTFRMMVQPVVFRDLWRASTAPETVAGFDLSAFAALRSAYQRTLPAETVVLREHDVEPVGEPVCLFSVRVCAKNDVHSDISRCVLLPCSARERPNALVGWGEWIGEDGVLLGGRDAVWRRHCVWWLGEILRDAGEEWVRGLSVTGVYSFSTGEVEVEVKGER
jgi:hypothetical protein